MKAALKLSQKGLGFTEPNPLVGAVVVKDNRIVGHGYHARFGAPHAEQAALQNVDVQGTTLYVTLEPCVHFGKTPPCSDLILKKKVARVVVAMRDPNPLVHGKGITTLKEHGLDVEVGLLEALALKINRHYIKYMTSQRPYVTLKAGVTIDCKLTDKNRQSQWITDESLREYSHSFRGEFSAIMVGVGTVINDNPLLTIRHSDWADKSLTRVVLDSHNSLDTRLNIFNDQERFPLILFSATTAANKTQKVKHHYFVPPNEDGVGLKLTQVLEVLHSLQIASVMVEGGGGLFDSFLRTQLYDEIVLSTAAKILGGQESVQFFASGTPIAEPVTLVDREIIPLETGYILRGFRPI